MPNQNKTSGEIAEILFTARAMQEGFVVCSPETDGATYDRVIEVNGKFIRVQIKSTAYREPERTGWRFTVKKGFDNRPYSEGDYDILAAYVVPENDWYIIPAEFVTKSLRVGGETKFEKYKNNWEVFK